MKNLKIYLTVLMITFLVTTHPTLAGEKEDSVRKMLVEKKFNPSIITVKPNMGFFALSKSALSRILRNVFFEEDTVIYSYTTKFRDSNNNKVFECVTYTSLEVDKKKESLPFDISGCKEISLKGFGSGQSRGDAIESGAK